MSNSPWVSVSGCGWVPHDLHLCWLFGGFLTPTHNFLPPLFFFFFNLCYWFYFTFIPQSETYCFSQGKHSPGWIIF